MQPRNFRKIQLDEKWGRILSKGNDFKIADPKYNEIYILAKTFDRNPIKLCRIILDQKRRKNDKMFLLQASRLLLRKKKFPQTKAKNKVVNHKPIKP